MDNYEGFEHYVEELAVGLDGFSRVEETLKRIGHLDVKVDEITERTVICDWFIPVISGKGIYIELWGVKGDEKYNKNKKEYNLRYTPKKDNLLFRHF